MNAPMRVAVSLFVVLSLAALPSAAQTTVSCPAPPPLTPVPSVSTPDLIADVCIPSPDPGNDTPYFDDFSWRSFIALVWPSLAGQRGVPDGSQPLGSGTPVFQTYKSTWEVFQNGDPPPDWATYSTNNSPCPQAPAGAFILASHSKFGSIQQAGIGGAAVAPIVSQNGRYVRYHGAYNQAVFDGIVGNQWYKRSSIPATGATFQALSGNNPITVKSAWIIVTPRIDAARFYTTDAWVLVPAVATCQQVQVALVGLHIVTKTATRPQWIWSTFEHVDNIPSQPGAQAPYTFSDGSGTPMPAVNPLAAFTTDPPRFPCAIVKPCPFNLDRLQPIKSSTAGTNQQYQQLIAKAGGGPWQNYQLVMTQWPTPPDTPSNPGTPAFTIPGTPQPGGSFANIVLETYFQGDVSTGCMACHTQAAAQPSEARTDFVWSFALDAFPTATGFAPNQPWKRIGPTQTAALAPLISIMKTVNQKNAAAQAKKPPRKRKK